MPTQIHSPSHWGTCSLGLLLYDSYYCMSTFKTIDDDGTDNRDDSTYFNNLYFNLKKKVLSIVFNIVMKMLT